MPVFVSPSARGAAMRRAHTHEMISMLFMYYGLLRVCSVFLCSPAAHMTPRADQARTHLEHLFLRNFYRILISDATFPSYGTPHRTASC